MLWIDITNAGSALANRKALVDAVQSSIEIGNHQNGKAFKKIEIKSKILIFRFGIAWCDRC